MPQDDVAADLVALVDKCLDHHMSVNEGMLIMYLVMYITERDHSVFDFAFDLGKRSEADKANFIKKITKETNEKAESNQETK